MTVLPPGSPEKPVPGSKTLTERIAALTPKQRAVYELKRRRLAREASATPAIPRRQGPGPWPATTDQAALWFIQQLDANTSAYNIGNGFRFRGDLDVALLERCFGEMVLRHEVLRTTFEEIDGRPHQVISPTFDARIEVADLRGATDPETAAGPTLAQLIKAPFDLEKGPLIRLPLVRLADDDYIMVGVMHHAVTDWWSYRLFFDELFRLYEARRRGRPSPLPALPIQFADWAAWRQEWLRSEEFETQAGYWRRKLEGAPLVLEVLGDRPRPPVQSTQGSREFFEVPPALVRAIRTINHDARTSSFMTLLAGVGVLLWRYTGQRDMLLGTPASFDRESEETRYMMGYLLNTLLLRIDLRGDPSFRQLLEQVRATCLDAFANKELPFRYLVEQLNPERDLSRMPVYQVEYLYVSAESPLAHEQRLFDVELPDFQILGFPIDRKTSPVDLQITFTEWAQGFSLLIEHNTDIYEPATVRRIGDHLLRLLEVLCADPEIPISQLSLLADVERLRIVETWNRDRWPPAPEQPLHRGFELQAAHAPDAVAVLVPGREPLTYGELDARANRLAAHLRRLGAGPETRVGLATSRSLEMMVGLYGILKTGAAYLPLDPSNPASRLKLMLEDGQVAVLLTEAALAESLPAGEIPVICLDRSLDRPVAGARGDATHDPPLDAAAYVIYTSGSTGRPKGVVVSHRNAVNYCHWMMRFLGRRQLSVTLACTSLSFDISLIELIVPLAAGGKVVLVENLLELPSLPPSLGLTTINTVPSAMRGLLRIGDVPATVRTILLAGEALGRPLVDSLYARSEADRIINGYGPTETTVYSLFHPLPRDDEGPVLIGRPPAATRVYALDRTLEPVPVAVPGELCIGGAGVARGYHRRPGLTAERFVPDPFAALGPGRRLYRTGDLVRCHQGGDFEFLGRVDHQVKIRGFRIELGEVETALEAIPEVHAAAAVVRDTAAGEKVIVAYLVAAADLELDTTRLRGLLAEHLPHYMVPTTFVRLDQLPLLPSGKVNRRALPETRDIGVASAYVAPRTETEKRLADVWMEVLERDEVGVHDDFFDLGGHSLRATQVLSRLRQGFGVDLPLRDLFDSPTLAELAARLGPAGAEVAELEPITPVPRGGDLPLSFSQERLWFLDQLEPGSASFNVPTALRLTGELRPRALERSFEEIVCRHEVLRTTFASRQGRPVQVVAAAAAWDLPLVDLRESSDEAQLRSLLRRAAERPFDLSRGPLLRTVLFRLDPQVHVLLIVLHHIVADGWSIGVLLRELTTLYRGLRAAPFQELPELPELPVQYADFAVWQRRRLDDELLAKQLDYWRSRLAGLRPLILPTDRSLPAERSDRGAMHHFDFGGELAQGVRELARLEGATLFMSLLAAFEILLYRTSGQSDFAVGTPIANRGVREIEGLVGCFINTLVLRTELSPELTSRQLVRRVKEVALGAYAHQDLPFEHLVDDLSEERDLSRSPLFQVLFVLQNTAADELVLPGLSIESEPLEVGTSKYDLTLFMSEVGDRLIGNLVYSTDLFDAPTAVRLAQHFMTVLGGMAENPERKLREIDLLTATERHQVLLQSQGPRAGLRPVLIHQLFEEQVRRTPDAVAVVHASDQLTYAALDQRANRLARALRSLGVARELRVGQLLERSPEMVIGLLAILKAGGVYLPLEPEYPRERLRFMIETSQARVIVTRRGLARHLPEVAGLRVLELDGTDTSVRPIERSAGGAMGQRLAHVIFTSGSTGTPKAVMTPHRAMVNYLRWKQEAFPLTAGDAVLFKTGTSFDGSIWEMLGPLAAGARVVIARGATDGDPGGHRDPAYLVSEITRRRVTVLRLVPSLLRVLLEQDRFSACRSLRWVFCAGEALDGELATRFFARSRSALVNLYGPTETTLITTLWRCRATPAKPADRHPGVASRSVPIGHPIANSTAVLLDGNARAVPPGVPGELYLGGEGVARGYQGRPALTAASFVPDRFSGDPGRRLYRSGDLARRPPGGALEFLGRLDHQIKLRGFRIEPGEIEALLGEHPAVRECCVVAPRGGQRLVAWVVIEGVAKGLREHLASRLPEHLVPQVFAEIDALPRLAGGKLDRASLQARDLPAGTRSPDHGQTFAPRNRFELELVRIWEELLDVRPIGIRDDFFALGGHSLLAVRLLAIIRNRLERELPLKSLFGAPTIESLAQSLAQEPVESVSPLVTLSPGGETRRPPLFCVHPAGGSVFCYWQLSEMLGPEQPFYGLQASVWDTPDVAPPSTIEEMASCYLDAIRELRQQGPYHLGGWSFGGLVAFEMARQLAATGEDVPSLILFDAAAPGGREELDDIRLLAEVASQEGLAVGEEELRALGNEQALARIVELAVRAKVWPPGEEESIERSLAVVKATSRAGACYAPAAASVSGHVVLFRARENTKMRELRGPDYGWQSFLGPQATPLEVYEVAGGHHSIMRDEHVEDLAGVLSRLLRAPAR